MNARTDRLAIRFGRCPRNARTVTHNPHDHGGNVQSNRPDAISQSPSMQAAATHCRRMRAMPAVLVRGYCANTNATGNPALNPALLARLHDCLRPPQRPSEPSPRPTCRTTGKGAWHMRDSGWSSPLCKTQVSASQPPIAARHPLCTAKIWMRNAYMVSSPRHADDLAKTTSHAMLKPTNKRTASHPSKECNAHMRNGDGNARS